MIASGKIIDCWGKKMRTVSMARNFISEKGVFWLLEHT